MTNNMTLTPINEVGLFDIEHYDEANAKVRKLLDDIRIKHNKVSAIRTPSKYVKKKPAGQGKPALDYVDIKYMKSMANKHFPGWSWEIVSYQSLSDKAFLVHGRLTWTDGVIKRTGDMVAGHRIQVLTSGAGYVDIGNDVKSANSDCFKKALNMYLNIADDIYRKLEIDVEEELLKLSKEQVQALLEVANSAGRYEKIYKQLQQNQIDTSNYEGVLAGLERDARILKRRKETVNDTTK